MIAPSLSLASFRPFLLALSLLAAACNGDPSGPDQAGNAGQAGAPAGAGGATSGAAGAGAGQAGAGEAGAGLGGASEAGQGGAGAGKGGQGQGGAGAGQGGAAGLGGSAGGEAGTAGAGAGGAGEAGAGGAGEAGAGGAASEQVPTEKAALFAWLQAGSYKGFAAESKVHPSTGPHGGGGVRVFLNAALLASFEAGNASHPAGSAAVKELYSGGQLSGWAVEVKTGADSDKGAGWFWYEVFSTTSGSSPIISAKGPNFCASCHEGGHDYVLIPYPLQ